MSATPLHLPRYISLEVSDPLDKPVLRSWLDTVTEHAPSGIVATVQKVDDTGSPRAVAVVHREIGKKHRYLIPLTRDLSDGEAEHIVEAFAAEHPDLDFDIETNQHHLSAQGQPKISMGQDQHVALCTAIAKQKHQDWMRERADAGWRYGPTFSNANKTHPLLRSWEDLPARYRQPDLAAPQKMLDVLTDQGYAVVPKEDLRKLLDMVQGGL